MVQDFLVYLIILAALIRTIFGIVNFVKSAKIKSRMVCSGCTGCGRSKIQILTK
jgi:hypothetical protein